MRVGGNPFEAVHADHFHLNPDMITAIVIYLSIVVVVNVVCFAANGLG
jgi:hypothetical protein